MNNVEPPGWIGASQSSQAKQRKSKPIRLAMASRFDHAGTVMRQASLQFQPDVDQEQLPIAAHGQCKQLNP